jgi:hypothetical protein
MNECTSSYFPVDELGWKMSLLHRKLWSFKGEKKPPERVAVLRIDKAVVFIEKGRYKDEVYSFLDRLSAFGGHFDQQTLWLNS